MANGNPVPQNETEEERKKREAAEAAAAQQQADNTGQQTPAAGTQQAAEGSTATAGTQQQAGQSASTQQQDTQQTEQQTTTTQPVGYLDFNGVRSTGDNALAQIRARFSGYKNLSAQTKLNEIISSGGHVSVQGDRVHFYDKHGNELDAKTLGINLPKSRFAKN